MSRGMQEKAESETNVQSWSWNKIPLFALNPQNRKKITVFVIDKFPFFFDFEKRFM
jgi:hypothetical protein